MALIEAVLLLSGRAPHQRERSVLDMRQHPVGDRQVIFGQRLLGDALLRVEHPVGARQAHAPDIDGFLGHGDGCSGLSVAGGLAAPSHA